MQAAKAKSSKWINKNKFNDHRFEWQSGYGAFSYSKSQVERVYNYIKNQEHHHKNKSLQQEYLEQLKAHDIPFNEKYIFKTPE